MVATTNIPYGFRYRLDAEQIMGDNGPPPEFDDVVTQRKRVVVVGLGMVGIVFV